MVNQKYYISLLSNWIRSVSKEYGIKESTFNNRSKNSMYFKYGTNQTLRISDHIQFAKGVNIIDINICIIFPKNTKDIIVTMEHDTYIYKSIAEVKEFLKTTFRYALLFEDLMVYPAVKKANKEITSLKEKIGKINSEKKQYATEVTQLKPKIKKIISKNKAVINSNETLQTKCKNYKLKIAELEKVISNYKEKIQTSGIE